MNRATEEMTSDVGLGPTVREPRSGRTASAPVRSVFDRPRERFAERGELGRGGMGRVVEALDRSFDRTVAIKHSLAIDDRNLARFEREARITARLQHPGIVPIFDAGRDDDGRPFYVMRKIDGRPLGELARDAPDVRARLALVPALLGAVDAAAYAHAQGVVHRDIKPWNILLGPFGESLLIDWGLARELADPETDSPGDDSDDSDALTRRGTAYGTPGYMAPEQARGELADRRADVYSLGATLYFVLTGESPFGTDGAIQAIAQAAAGQPPDRTRISREVSAELIAIVDKAVAANAAERYADAGELAADLRRFLAGQLVAAHDYTAAERVARWIKRHRLVTATASVAIIAIAAIAIVSVRRVVAERDEADAARRLAEARAEEMLVDRARTMAGIDPTSAVALLRGLPAASPMWPTAREIVRGAVANGVERALVAHRKRITVASFAPDGRLATSSIDGTIQVHDLSARTSRIVAAIAADDLGWLDARTLVYLRRGTFSSVSDSKTGLRETVTPPEVGAIDLVSGARRVLVDRPFQDLRNHAGRLVVLVDGSVVTFARDGTRELVVPAGIAAIDERAGWLALLGRDRLTVTGGDGTRRERPVQIDKPILAVRISPDGEHVAAILEGELVEWSVSTTAAPRRWQRSTGGEVAGDRSIRTYDPLAVALHNVNYIASTLYGWSPDGTRAVSFDADEPTTRWRTVGTPLAIAPSRDGALLATVEGRLAYATSSGVVEIPHRAIDVSFGLVDDAGTRAVVCTTSNELLVLDLTTLRPRMRVVPQSTKLLAVRGDQAVVATPGARGVPILALLDLPTGARVELGSVGVGAEASLFATAVVGHGNDRGYQRATWDLAGHELTRFHGEAGSIGPGLHAVTSAFEVTSTGDVMEEPIEPQGPRTVLANVGPVDPSRFLGVAPYDAGLAIVASGSPHRRAIWIDREGRYDRELDVRGQISSAVRTRDGTWWVTAPFVQVWRIPPGGVPVEVTLPQPTRRLRLVDDEVWALADAAVMRLAPDGTFVGTAALVGRDRTDVAHGFAVAARTGVEIVMPIAATRRTLALPTTARAIAASDDARTVAALVPVPGDQVAIAWWLDPVPSAPVAVPAYLDAITNARLALGSDAIVWDPK